MNIDIRKSIIDNFKNSSKDEIKESIISSLKMNEEITLPGMGVFFEILWQNCSNELKDEIINIISDNL
ncbi:MAG: small acid-soluble spore protein SspI [Firmicutes bacterium]|nr:small acid-soluble spore protein SspI [Bacillota bacterium]